MYEGGCYRFPLVPVFADLVNGFFSPKASEITAFVCGEKSLHPNGNLFLHFFIRNHLHIPHGPLLWE